MTLIVTWLWQGLAIAWITAAAVRAMPRLNAATRHAVWWLALAAVWPSRSPTVSRRSARYAIHARPDRRPRCRRCADAAGDP